MNSADHMALSCVDICRQRVLTSVNFDKFFDFFSSSRFAHVLSSVDLDCEFEFCDLID